VTQQILASAVGTVIGLSVFLLWVDRGRWR
jgi:hypothetical protein